MYRIIKQAGQVSDTFKVQERCRFLFWHYWSTLGHVVPGGLSPFDMVSDYVDHEFPTQEAAEQFAVARYPHMPGAWEIVAYVPPPQVAKATPATPCNI